MCDRKLFEVKTKFIKTFIVYLTIPMMLLMLLKYSNHNDVRHPILPIEMTRTFYDIQIGILME